MRSHLFSSLLLTLVVLLVAACHNESPSAPPSRAAEQTAPQSQKIRGPAVAGLFYCRHEEDLRREVDQHLAEAKTDAKSTPIENLRALVCPHAGYKYSGPIAATAYKQLAGRNFSTVILLGPSHYAAFAGAFVSTADAYETPLGMVPVSPKATELAKIQPFSANPACEVQRPAWWREAPKDLPPFGEDSPETWEHSLEVQLPFLQRTLKQFSIVPIVFGRVDPGKAAQALLPFLDDDTLIIVSTDLSHYEPYGKAKTLDSACVKAICELRGDLLKEENACGRGPLLCLIDIARKKGWKAKLLDARNSGDTSGDRSAVVGYAAIAFSGPAEPAKPPATESKPRATLTPAQHRLLLELARRSVTAAATGSEPPRENADAPEAFRARRACFVTLTKKGELRGCIGSIFPEESLYQAVIRRAKSAATEDPRFPPVRSNELKEIEIEISVLTVPKALAFASPDDLLAKLRPGVDGVVLHVDDGQATYLPQVWEQLPDKRQFMNELAKKAGLPAYAWRKPGATVMTYQVEAFKEEHH
jgi:AmmeMemoRadiSam system protein B/AmmeMemoRadiSam system protein A